ncbi:MAG: queuosine precursor transporter [Pseudomonadota bacterium]
MSDVAATSPTQVIDPALLAERRERVFLVLAGVFICAMTMLNILGITRFIQMGPLQLAVGTLPYPITFLCTDLICELYGKRRANFMVTLGLGLNFFILGFIYLGNLMPAVPADALPPWQMLQLAAPVSLPDGSLLENQVELYQLIYATTSGAVFASMMAYIAAQYCDVQLFHFWKRVTKGKYLWVRNNFSTMISQLVDSFMVILVTFGAVYMAGDMSTGMLLTLMVSNYGFKFAVAVLDTGPFYLCVYKLRGYLGLAPGELA